MMGHRLMCVLAALALGAGAAQAGQGVQTFSVDDDVSPKPIATTPQGVQCPLGIAAVKGVQAERFEFEGAVYSMKELPKALRKANKPKRFDCVVIEGGTPDTGQVVRAIKALKNGPIHHVEWAGTRPVISQGAN